MLPRGAPEGADDTARGIPRATRDYGVSSPVASIHSPR